MNPENLKRGDFFTWTSNKTGDCAICRVMEINRYEDHAKHENKVFDVTVLMFPKFYSEHHITNVERFYIEHQCIPSTDFEISVWLKCAKAYRNSLADKIKVVDATVGRRIVKSKVVPVDSCKTFKYFRHPPALEKNYLSWMWSTARRFKLWSVRTAVHLLTIDKAVWGKEKKVEIPYDSCN